MTVNVVWGDESMPEPEARSKWASKLTVEDDAGEGSDFVQLGLGAPAPPATTEVYATPARSISTVLPPREFWPKP